MADRKNRMLAAIDKAAAWISPTIDATPGRETFEDKIDRFIFDPQSNIAPLEILLWGSGKAGVQALKAAGAKSTAAINAARASSPQFDKAVRVASAPREALEDLGKYVGEKLGHRAHDLGYQAFEEMLNHPEVGDRLQKEIRRRYPDIIRHSNDYDEVFRGLKLMAKQGDDWARGVVDELLPMRSHVMDAVGKAAYNLERYWKKWAPKDQMPWSPTPSNVVKSGVVSAISAREKARRLADGDRAR